MRYLLPSGAVRTTADGRSTRWEEHRQTRRKELVESALRAIRDHGAGVGMDEIAAAAGTSKTVFYRHFTDRAGLYRAVSERVDALILRDVSQALGASGEPLTDLDDEPRQLIGAAIDAYLALVERDPEVYRFVVAAPLLEHGEVGVTGDPARQVSGHVAEQIGVLIRAALVDAGADPSPAQLWGHGLVGLVRASADAWLRSGADRMSRADLSAHLTTLAWSGVSSAWTRPRRPRASA